MTDAIKIVEPTVFDLSSPGRTGVTFPASDVPAAALPPEHLLRPSLPLPELAEVDVVRHYMRLSKFNYSVDSGFYPLGSCTMKYNPKIDEDTCRLPGFVHTHPLQPIETVQGNLALMYQLQEWLKEISGFAAITLQPAAGAHGEFTGVLMMRAYHASRGDTKRVKMLIPDSAHGTNPASSGMIGLQVVQIPSDARGNVDLEALKAQCDDTVVGIMVTNPNTLGMFDENIEQVVKMVHDCGGLVYGDGANLNALLGIVRPGDLGIDVMHFNLHKTFAVPHGGGGPGSGPVGVAAHLADFLPEPLVGIVEDESDDQPPLFGFVKPAKSIGRMKAFHGHFGGGLVRTYTYIAMQGPDGLKDIAQYAVLNANYLLARLRDTYHVPYDRICMHEFVAEGQFEGSDVRALDIAKRLMDYNFHPPTNYFPLIVREALMIEPTETENKDTLDAFADAMIKIAEEAKTSPELLHNAPHITPFGRMDEVKAARELALCCWLPEDYESQ
ncbi:MAG: putative glycine dehydrogenase (decarboxylating) subunit 2 [Anaerolineaceae bacterium]|jgi:glycine dehydrogenase subunit 2|nr:glycine dehydrogenase subunit 2 [Anaerolineae bacterium]MBV6464896.1 putative glycine dehydrogenase (decarboxylating) subunit 2 [Anaerolineales bacterium]MCE7904341.1 glycine dehydrogenase subunit 2 [Anaerolineae bacterium CFX3]MDL1925458.1 glycine dehydrogenase subunit 2 [Anaerolineae bacterium AMX1]OQY83170.1 MAG: glycine dehydrogenase (aminomethyl-transferring) [Anaerolineae bacterium UTCFX3]GIK09939.1 MAG: putative glycine dehydrogenase (decarboxylating) subunit 2 [Chloroflexota bacteri